MNTLKSSNDVTVNNLNSFLREELWKHNNFWIDGHFVSHIEWVRRIVQGIVEKDPWHFFPRNATIVSPTAEILFQEVDFTNEYDEVDENYIPVGIVVLALDEDGSVLSREFRIARVDPSNPFAFGQAWGEHVYDDVRWEFQEYVIEKEVITLRA